MSGSRRCLVCGGDLDRPIAPPGHPKCGYCWGSYWELEDTTE